VLHGLFRRGEPGVPARPRALAAAGRTYEAEAAFGSIEAALRKAGVANWARAHLDAAAGDHDAAFEHLASAAAAREPNVCTASVSPYFARMHGDARWPQLVAQWSLPKVAESAWSGGVPGSSPH